MRSSSLRKAAMRVRIDYSSISITKFQLCITSFRVILNTFPWLIFQDISYCFLAPLQALSKTLTEDELFYLREQFALLEPDKNGSIKLDNVKTVSTSYPHPSLFP